MDMLHFMYYIKTICALYVCIKQLVLGLADIVY